MANNKIDLEPGVYRDVPFEDYVAIDAINHSTLKRFSWRSPYHFKNTPEDNDEADHLSMGRKLHEAVLEPNLFENKYLPEPSPEHWEEWKEIFPDKSIEKLKKDPTRITDGRTKEARLIKEAFADKIADMNQGLLEDGEMDDDAVAVQAIKRKEYNTILAMKKSIMDNPVCQKLLHNAETEITLVWHDEETGLKCKGRLDANSQKKGFFADIKTTKNAHPRAFEKDIGKYNYNSAAAFYMDGARTLGFDEFKTIIWIAIEKVEPFYVQPFFVRANSGWIDHGRTWYRNVIEKLHYCKSTDTWKGYYDAANDNHSIYEIPDQEWML